MKRYRHAASGLQIKKVAKPAIQEKVDDLLAMLHLEDFRKRYPKDLSGGMRQRVAIARVLAIDSPILLMEEQSRHNQDEFRGAAVE